MMPEFPKSSTSGPALKRRDGKVVTDTMHWATHDFCCNASMNCLNTVCRMEYTLQPEGKPSADCPSATLRLGESIVPGSAAKLAVDVTITHPSSPLSGSVNGNHSLPIIAYVLPTLTPSSISQYRRRTLPVIAVRLWFMAMLEIAACPDTAKRRSIDTPNW